MAVRKLENVRKDHEKRLEMLHISQETDQYKAQLIESNVEMVFTCVTLFFGKRISLCMAPGRKSYSSSL